MKTTKKHQRVLDTAIAQWQRDGVITPEQAHTMKNSYTAVGFGWQRVARYAFWVSCACVIIAVTAALSDQWLIAMFEQIFDAPAEVKSATFAFFAFIFYAYGIQRKRTMPQKIYSNEALLFFGVLSTATATFFLAEAMGYFSVRPPYWFLLATALYAGVGLYASSALIWCFALFSFGGWFGAETFYAGGAYYLGMNYPVRFFVFGLLLLSAGYALFYHWKNKRNLLATTKIVGLLYVFMSLWILSLVGNGHDWLRATELELAVWSLLFGVAALAAIAHGIRYYDNATKGFGIAFLFINLYTKFFEYFWDDLHKAIFFAVLGASFWYLGVHAEKVMRFGVVERLVGRKD